MERAKHCLLRVSLSQIDVLIAFLYFAHISTLHILIMHNECAN